MNIATKYDVGQIVWIMFNNEPETWKVTRIHLGDIAHPNTSPMITYDLTHHGLNHCGGVHAIQNVMEHKIHATKRDLLNSFLTDKD